MPDPDSPPPTLSDYLAMASSPIAPQPYQKRFLAALQDGSRLETSSERWNRERRQSLESLQAAANQLVAAFRPVGIAARRAAARLEPLCRLLIGAKRGSPIGRKRRARRARGRR
jgi:hypothetical protein